MPMIKLGHFPRKRLNEVKTGMIGKQGLFP